MNDLRPVRARLVPNVPLKAIIVLVALACIPWSAAAAPTDVEATEAPAARLVPLAEERCRDLAERLGDALAHEVTMLEVPFVDPVSDGSGLACRAVAIGTGEDFGSFLDVANLLRETLDRAGWQEDERYLADGPTGTATAYRSGDARVLLNVGWSPAEAAHCPEDRPIFECDVAPAHQEFEITMTAARERADAAPAEGGVAELARRLLGPWGDPAGTDLVLTPGSTPHDLPFELPLPPDARIVGSLERRDPSGRLLSAQVVADAAATTDATMSFFDEAFGGMGWAGRPEGMQVGFVPPQADLFAMYCSPEGNAFVYLNVFFVRNAPTDVRVDVQLEESSSPCSAGVYDPPEPFHAPMPSLPAPEGSDVTVHGGQLLPEEASSMAIVRTDRSAADLFAHYEARLEGAGWIREGRTASGRVRYGEWRLERNGAAWRALLDVAELGGGAFRAGIVVLPAGGE